MIMTRRGLTFCTAIIAAILMIAAYSIPRSIGHDDSPGCTLC
jgi:preprotein translocase subunit SecF